MEQLYKQVTIESTSEDGIITAYASTYDVDYDNDKVVKGAFEATLKSKVPVMLFDHDTSMPIGKWLELREDDRGLYVKGQLLVDTVPKAKEVYELIKSGAISGLSIGFSIDDYSYEGSIRLLKQVTVYEISIVSIPCNDNARVISVKSISNIRDIEDMLKAKGFSRKESKEFISKCKSILSDKLEDNIKLKLKQEQIVDSILKTIRKSKKLLTV